MNAVRRQIYDQTGDSQLKPYTSWADLVQHLKHPESVINFIAAYGTHAYHQPSATRWRRSAPRRRLWSSAAA